MKTLATMLPDYEVRFLGFGVFENRPIYDAIVLAEWIESVDGKRRTRTLCASALPPGRSTEELMKRRVRHGSPWPVDLKSCPNLEACIWTDGVDGILSVFVPGSRGIVEIELVEISTEEWYGFDAEDLQALAEARLSITRRG